MTEPPSTVSPNLPPRERILRAAALLLEESDGAAVSTRDVTRLAEVTAPTLYHHFKDKAGLVDAVVTDAFRRYLELKKEALTEQTPIGRLRAGWDMHVDFGVAQPVLYGLMYDSPQSRQEIPAARMAHEALQAGLETLQGTGLLVVPVAQAAAMLEAAATGATLYVIRSRGSANDPYVQSLRDAVIARLTGIGPEHVTNNYVEIARHLLLALPDSEVPSLRPSELALLRDWLHRITII